MIQRKRSMQSRYFHAPNFPSFGAVGSGLRLLANCACLDKTAASGLRPPQDWSNQLCDQAHCCFLILKEFNLWVLSTFKVR